MLDDSRGARSSSVGASVARLQPRSRDYGLTLGGALGISTAPILVTLAEAHATPIAAWRFAYALPGLALLCLLRVEGRRSFSRPGWRGVAALSGLLFAGDLLLWHRSILLVGAGPAALLVNTHVVWVALFGLALLGERPAPSFWLTLPVLAVGLVLLCGGGPEGIPLDADRRGLALGLAAGVAYAGALICMRRAQRVAPVVPEAVLVVQLAVGLCVVVAVGHAEGTLPVGLRASQHLWLALLGVGVQVFAWLAITRGIRSLPGHHGALLLLMQPVGSLVLGGLVLGQGLRRARLAGALLVLVAIAGAVLGETSGPRRSARPTRSRRGDGRSRRRARSR